MVGPQPRRHAGDHRAAGAALGPPRRSLRPQDHGRALARQLRHRDGGDGVRHAAVARLRAARAAGAVRRLRRAGADDGGRFGAAGRMAYAIGTVQTAQRLGPALGPVIGGVVAQLVGLRARSSSRPASTSSRWCSCSSCTTSAARRHEPSADRGRGRVTFRSVLAFENFILLMAVIFGLQFVDRSFGPVLPLYVAELGHAARARAARRRRCSSRSPPAPARSATSCARWLLRGVRRGTVIAGGGASPALSARWSSCSRAATAAGRSGDAGLRPGASASRPPPPTPRRAASFRPSARGAGFGLLTTASLVGLALSPIVSGLLAATQHSRGVRARRRSSLVRGRRRSCVR